MATTFTNVANPAFGTVTQLNNSGYSHYNGGTATFQRKFSAGFQAQVSYTYSHATDTVSNGGVLPFSGNDSLLTQFSPLGTGLNYGNADYDVRHAINANYVYQVPFTFGNKFVNFVAGGWTVAGTVFYHTGYPFTVTDSTAGFFRNAAGAAIPANITGPVDFNSCTSGPSIDVNAAPCLGCGDLVHLDRHRGQHPRLLQQPAPQPVPRTRLLQHRPLAQQGT